MKPIVYIGGTFDLFHVGHVRLLYNASLYGDVVVALNTDDFAERYKRRPIMTLEERLAVVQACRWVEHVDVNEGGEDSSAAILRVGPEYIVHGDDWKGEALLVQLGITEQFLADHEIRMLYLPYTSEISTSEVIERCRSSSQ